MLKKLIATTSLCYLIFLIIFTALTSCKKTEDEIPDQQNVFTPTFAYEVNCDYCQIIYTDENNKSQTISNHTGKWNYKIASKTLVNLKLNINTTLANYQTIHAYILKDGEVIYGNLGYNRAEILYNTMEGKGSSSFGTYIASGSSAGSNQNGASSSTSSVCGAKNKSGGYCKRVVSGGGRCWQHP